jgi:hypothetical protein
MRVWTRNFTLHSLSLIEGRYRMEPRRRPIRVRKSDGRHGSEPAAQQYYASASIRIPRSG